MDAIIETAGLTKTFNGLKAVYNLDLEVYRGEIFGFLGPNGAGKTTTIRMLTGILTPDKGKIFIDGTGFRKHLLEAKMKMGVIPEMSNIYVDLSAKQNIIMAGKFYRVPRKVLQNRAEQLLEKFGLLDRMDQPVKVLSKGLKQRVTIACSFVHEPPILFLDEPTSGLDVQSQRLIRNAVKEMNRKGATIFLTTHNIEEANTMCDRIGIINSGRMAAVNTPEQLKRTYEHSRSVEVSFDRPADISVVKENPVVDKIEKLGDKWKLYTEDPDRLIKYLAEFIQQKNIRFTSLQICGASLEDIFLKLTEEKVHAN